jgi:hypothetical protein
MEWFFFVHVPETFNNEEQQLPEFVFDPTLGEWIRTNETFYNQSNLEEQSSDFDFFGFMTFTMDKIPDWIKPFYAIVSIIVNIIGIYLIVSWVYDWIKALPLT